MSYLRLKELFKEKNIKQKELAEKIDLSPNMLSLIVQEKSQPRFETLERIANELGVDIRDIFQPTLKKDSKALYINIDGEFKRIGEIVSN